MNTFDQSASGLSIPAPESAKMPPAGGLESDVVSQKLKFCQQAPPPSRMIISFLVARLVEDRELRARDADRAVPVLGVVGVPGPVADLLAGGGQELSDVLVHAGVGELLARDRIQARHASAGAGVDRGRVRGE